VNLLELDDLCVAYDTPHGRRTVVDGLSLALPRGDIGCLLGASGCGKTTVLRAIAGFEPVRMGRIVLDGTPVAAPSLDVPPERRRIGMMFQDYALFPHLSTADNVAFGLRRMPKAERRTRVADMLELVGLADAGSAYPHELSGGQQQRVAAARAIVTAPALLLADEPTGNLDTARGREIMNLLVGLNRDKGITVVMVTHEPDMAAYAHRIIRFKDGLVDEDAVVEEAA